MDRNEFPSIFQKVQYSHSRHQKTTSHLLRINLKGILKLNEIWPLEGAMYITLWDIKVKWNVTTRGSYVHNYGIIFRDAKFLFYAVFSENWWFPTKRFTGLLELIQLYKQYPLEKFFIFTIYQNYTLALNTEYYLCNRNDFPCVCVCLRLYMFD